MADTPDSSSGSQSYEGYVLDAENAAEMGRLMLQDQVITQALGGPLPEQTDIADASKEYRILDIGCGPGGWLFNVVQQYPHIHGIGIDISQLMTEYATSIATAENLSNIQFRVMDATQPLNFPDNTFDMVNGRILIGFLLKEQWPALLAECRRVTKPGGILRLTEVEWGFTNSPAYDTYAGFGAMGTYKGGHSFSPHGRTYGITPMLRRLMLQAGYHEVEQRANVVDYSAGTVAYESNTHNFLVFYKLFQPFLVQLGLATQEELDRIHAQMETEMRSEDFCAIDYYLTVWGRK